jgi:hypothetical protein
VSACDAGVNLFFLRLMRILILSCCAGPKPEPQRHSPVESILAWGQNGVQMA